MRFLKTKTKISKILHFCVSINSNFKVDERFSSLKKTPHYPVMVEKVMEICRPEKGGIFVDCTFGAGGYSKAILSFPNTKVIALDRDDYTRKYAKVIKEKYKNRFAFHNLKFSELYDIIPKNTKLDSIIFDLGLSSLQISNLKEVFHLIQKES